MLLPAHTKFGVKMNDPATDQDLQDLEAALGCKIDGFLRRLYKAHDGFPQVQPVLYPPMRMMPITEAIECQGFVSDLGWSKIGLRLFWTDDNSNYAALYVDGPMQGRIAFIDHDEATMVPVYRDVPSFVMSMEYGVENHTPWYELNKHYPLLAPISEEDMASDWAAVEELRPYFDVESDDAWRVQYAYCMMALTPPDKTETIVQFTYDDDFYIQEYACKVIGQRRYKPAEGRLQEVAALSIPNAPMAAKLSLKKTNSDQS